MINFGNNVLEQEGLSDWTIKWENGDGGLCLRENKIILIGRESSPAMVLHEIAHAKTPNSDGIHAHDVFWGDEFTRLVAKYMTVP